jgi:hypothetical protein
MSPRTKARLAGALFLTTIIGGIVAQEGLAGGLIVGGDAAATANNIMAHQSLFRAAFAVYMVEMSCQVAMVAVFYDLFMPVDHSIARASAAFGYIGCGIKALSRLFMYAPLFVLGGSSYLSVFDPKQLQAGSSEIRNWLIAVEAVKELDLEWVEYVPGYRSPALTGTGLCFAAWRTLP